MTFMQSLDFSLWPTLSAGQAFGAVVFYFIDKQIFKSKSA
jgi:hypothetical protein